MNSPVGMTATPPAAAVGLGQSLVLERLEARGGAEAGGDVAFGLIGGEPPDQVLAQPLGQGGVGAVLEPLAAAVQLGLGGRWQPGIVLLFGGVHRYHPDRLIDDGGVAVGGAGELARLGGPGYPWEVEGDHSRRSLHRAPRGQGLGKVPRCPFRSTSCDWGLCLPSCGFRWEDGATGCLRHVTFATKRDFAGTLTKRASLSLAARRLPRSGREDIPADRAPREVEVPRPGADRLHAIEGPRQVVHHQASHHKPSH
jgi:hypothetical protein